MVWYYIISFLIALAFGALTVWLVKNNVSVKWWEWLIGVIGVLGIIATLQHGFATFLENEPYAFWPGVLTFGLPAVILLVVSWQLVARRQKSS